jgi:hypothetical protein
VPVLLQLVALCYWLQYFMHITLDIQWKLRVTMISSNLLLAAV